MIKYYYRDINLTGVKSGLFDMLKKYDENFLDKELNFDKESIIINHFNNRYIDHKNLELVLEFCDYLMIDRADIQKILISSISPSSIPYKLSLESCQHYNLPKFMTDSKYARKNLILDSSKMGLSKWLQFGIDNNYVWDNRAFYFSKKNSYSECYNLLKKYNKHKYFGEGINAELPVNIRYLKKSGINRQYIPTPINSRQGDIVIDDNIQHNYFNTHSSCPSSVPSSSSTLLNLPVSAQINSCVKNNLYQVIFNTNTEQLEVCELKIDNEFIYITNRINAALYGYNWNSIFNKINFHEYTNRRIKISIHLHSLDFRSIKRGEEWMSLEIPIIKEYELSPEYLIIQFNNIINDQDFLLKMISELEQDILLNKNCRKNKMAIEGILINTNIIIKTSFLNINEFKDIFKSIETPKRGKLMKIGNISSDEEYEFNYSVNRCLDDNNNNNYYNV